MNTYISKDRRQDLIEQYLDCWWDTSSYSTRWSIWIVDVIKLD